MHGCYFRCCVTSGRSLLCWEDLVAVNMMKLKPTQQKLDFNEWQFNDMHSCVHLLIRLNTKSGLIIAQLHDITDFNVFMVACRAIIAFLYTISYHNIQSGCMDSVEWNGMEWTGVDWTGLDWILVRSTRMRSCTFTSWLLVANGGLFWYPL